MGLSLKQFARRLLKLQAVVVEGVWLETGRGAGPTVVIHVRLRRRRHPRCSRCGRGIRSQGHEIRSRRWKTLPVLGQAAFLEAEVRRVYCSCRGAAHTEEVPWARPGARVTRILERAVAKLSRRTDTTTAARQYGLSWRTVAAIEARLAAEQLTPARFDGLVALGIDEISHRRGQHYLTVVTDLLVGDVVWVGEGRSEATLAVFFEELGEERCGQLQAVACDLHRPFHNAVRRFAPKASLAFDRFHLVKLINEALDELRREEFRRLDDSERTWIKGTRWALLKDPSWLTDPQSQSLRTLERRNRRLYRGYLLKEQFRDAWVWDNVRLTRRRLKCWLNWAVRSRLRPIVRFAHTVRDHLQGILDAVEMHLSTGPVEGINNKIKTLMKRSYGFRSAESFIHRIYFCCLDFQIQ